MALVGAVAMVIGLSSCSHGSGKDYDIGPVFPLSSDKCAKYDGRAEGSGITAHCWVTKDECQQAVADWRQSMLTGGVNDAIQFTCTSG